MGKDSEVRGSVECGESRLEEVTLTEEGEASTPSSHRPTARTLTQTPRCKRSLSLPPIPPSNGQDFPHTPRLQAADLECRLRMGDFQPDSSNLSPRERSLALKGLVGFLKNAWRKEKMRGEYHRLTSMSLSNEIEKAKLQISVLKSIVRSDETILADWVRDVQASKATVEKLKKEKTELAEEKNHIQRQLETLQKELEEQKIELLNEKNNFFLTKNEAEALGEQLDKERQKILKLKREKQELMDKMKGLNNAMQSKDAQIVKLQGLKSQFHAKLTTQSKLVMEQCERQVECQKSLEAVKESLNALNKDVVENKNLGFNFQREYERFRSTINVYKTHCDVIEKNAHEQLLKIVEMQMKKHYEDQEEKSWKSTLVNVANKFVGVPLYTFQTLVRPQML